MKNQKRLQYNKKIKRNKEEYILSDDFELIIKKCFSSEQKIK